MMIFFIEMFTDLINMILEDKKSKGLYKNKEILSMRESTYSIYKDFDGIFYIFKI